MRYRRADVKGGTYFFTVNLANRNHSFLVDEFDKLRTAFNLIKQKHPFILDALVVLPEHIHTIWTLPPNDNNFSMRLGLIKSNFSRLLPKVESISTSRQSKGERGIWQRRYWEHLIRNEEDYQRHIDYIHYNPVKHGYVKRAVDWKYSTIHDYIKKDIISSGWGGDYVDEQVDNFGE